MFGLPGTPVTVLTRPPETAGPRLRNFRLAKGPVGLSAVARAAREGRVNARGQMRLRTPETTVAGAALGGDDSCRRPSRARRAPAKAMPRSVAPHPALRARPAAASPPTMKRWGRR